MCVRVKRISIVAQSFLMCHTPNVRSIARWASGASQNKARLTVAFTAMPTPTHLVTDEVHRVVGVSVLEQEVRVDRPCNHPGLKTAEPLEPRVARGKGPHGHSVEEVHVLGGRLLPRASRTDGHRHEAQPG